MSDQYQPYVPETVGELLDKLASMLIYSPTFKDPSGYFPGKNINTEFFALHEGLKNVRQDIGQERYEALVEMSAKMRRHFEADQNDETHDSVAGREIILEMEEVLKGSRRKRR